MSDFNKIYSDAKEIAKKAVKKGGELSEIAALKIKILAKRKDISEQYKFLGAYVYKKLNTEDEAVQAELTEKISNCVNKIDYFLAELAELNAEYKAKTEEKKPEPEFTLTPEEVMENFSHACDDAKKANEKAIQLAKEAEKIANDAK